MRKLLFVFVVFLFAGSVFAEDWNRYDQEVTVEFQTANDAEAAAMTAMELPPGKTLALGSRWDDTNYAHLQMTQTLSENGWKGTFFLNRIDNQFIDKVVRPIVKDGSSIGAHSMTHPHLETVPVNKMFYELLGNRVTLESATDLCVTTFTFPFGLRSDKNSLSSAGDQAEALYRTGLLGGPERIGIIDRLGGRPERFIAPYMFSANDRDPDPKMFAQQFQHGLDLVRNNKLPCGPYMVLGVHSWQASKDKNGFKRLSKILATESNKPEYWNCNSNEYTAWRLGFLENTIVKKNVSGNRVTFTVSRVLPMEWGAVQSMGLAVKPVPKKVVLNGSSLEVTGKGEFMLPHSDGYVLPEKIGRIDNLKNESEKSDSLTCSKIPGVQFGTRIDTEKNVLYCHLSNTSEEAMSPVYFTVRLPLKWKKGILRHKVENIAAGKSIDFELPLGEVNEGSRYEESPLFIANCCDFRRGTGTYRIYSTVNQK